MNYKYPEKKSLKNFFKKFILLVKLKRIIFKFLSIQFIIKKIYFILRIDKFFNLNFFKKIKFNVNNNEYFIHYTKKNIFILSGKDQKISRSIYLNTVDRKHSTEKIMNLKKILNNFKNKKITQIIDVGASLGNVIITSLTEKVFETGIAIEPSKEDFKILKSNVILNDLEDKIKLYNCAITNSTSKYVNFELDESDIGDQRVFYKKYSGLFGEQNRKIIEVKNFTLDNLFKDTNFSNSLLWLNNQGSEAHVINGGKKILSKYKPPILFEYSPYYMKNSDSHSMLINDIKDIYSEIYDPFNMQYLGNLNKFNFNKIYNELGERGEFTYFLIV